MMKKNQKLKKCAMLLLMFCMISIPVSATVPAVAASTSTVQPKSDTIGWKYKEIDGKLYKRLYNFTTSKWIGDWILVK